ncbi:hypothetical protein PM082_021217 [Marasmius tenuissimus]|nr:hypothetical protein PM082_021217 [Marasmius tenuissimus]
MMKPLNFTVKNLVFSTIHQHLRTRGLSWQYPTSQIVCYGEVESQLACFGSQRVHR